MVITMKKLLLLPLTAAVVFGGINAANAQGDITLRVNGEEIKTDTAPIIVNDRVLVPVRAVSEALKSDVAWDEEKKAVTVFDGEYLYFMWIDRENAFKINGVALEDTYKMDAVPMIYNDRTMIPVRAISELFGAEVNWLNDERTVTVDYEPSGVEVTEGIASELYAYTESMSEMYEEYSDYAFEKKNVVKAEIELDNGGIIGLELYKDIAPLSVENFVKLSEEGAFDGQNFHRVIKDFMNQGGAFDEKGQYTDSDSIDGEFMSNGYFNLISHDRGVVSMARTNNPDSGSNQFFIVHENAPHLDGEYAAFGCVYEGMEYVDRIAETETDASDKPLENQVIKTVRIINTPTEQ